MRSVHFVFCVALGSLLMDLAMIHLLDRAPNPHFTGGMFAAGVLLFFYHYDRSEHGGGQ